MSSTRTPSGPRRRPSQARSRQTVEAILEGAARVFRREGWDATTNRIAEEAGVGIGTLYEYFPNKEALLHVLAERHVELAERHIAEAMGMNHPNAELLAELQRAILESQRFPSHALVLVERSRPDLRARADSLRSAVLRELERRAGAASLDEPRLRALAAFSAIGELTSRAIHEHPDEHAALARHYLAMARDRLPDGSSAARLSSRS